MNRRLSRLAVATACAFATVPAAQAAAIETSASVEYAAQLLSQPLGKPWDLGLTVAATFRTADGSPPAAMSRIAIQFPQAKVNDDAFPACSLKEFLRAGPESCPAKTRLGTGLAMVDARPLLDDVHADLTLFNGPRAKGGRTLLLYAKTREVQAGIPMTGVLRRTGGRYGYSLSIDVPKIHVLDTVRDPSIKSFEIEVKAFGRGRRSFIQAPRSCPRGGLPFATTVSFHDGPPRSSASVIPCVLRSQPAG